MKVMAFGAAKHVLLMAVDNFVFWKVLRKHFASIHKYTMALLLC